MPRRRKIAKKPWEPDPKYNSALVTRFVSSILKHGKRAKAEKIFYDTMAIIEKKTKQPGIEVFEKAVNNVKPYLEVRSRRVGGSNYQVPVEVKPSRRTALAIRWILTFTRGRSGKGMSDRLAEELIAAFNNEGSAIKKKDDTHKMAEANKAFAHFRW
ncbi:MAG: 30S ribosomal protein S7 [candidate division Zixibacteria bacterium]|nr:30S ribosomal protein S7 [candidate division Zixibacteria bacterium]